MNQYQRWQERLRRDFDFASPLFFVLGILFDLFTKMMVVSGKWNSQGTFFDLMPKFNVAFVGGLFADANEWVVQIFFTIISVFLFIFSTTSFFILRRQDMSRLKYGTVLLASGVSGNVLDRVLHGRVTDIFIFKFTPNAIASLNLADLFCVIGSVLVFLSLFLDSSKIFSNYNLKRKLLIEPKFQIEFSLILVFIGILNAGMIGVYSYSYLRVYLSQAGYVVLGVNDLMTDYLIGLVIMEFFFLIATFIIGIIFSHKMIGPIQAFEGFVRRLLNGTMNQRDQNFRLRQLDYFKNFERLAILLREKWASKGNGAESDRSDD
jgi:lipoprotein signal peptidase